MQRPRAAGFAVRPRGCRPAPAGPGSPGWEPFPPCLINHAHISLFRMEKIKLDAYGATRGSPLRIKLNFKMSNKAKARCKL